MRAVNSFFLALTVVVLAILAGCGGSSSSSPNSNAPAVVAKGSRVLAIDALYGASLSSNLQAAQDAGAQSVTQLVTWTMIETSPGVYDTTVLQPAATQLPAKGMSLSLMVAVINTSVKDMPADLQALSFDDPTVISRFETLLDRIFAALPQTQFASLGIGNEVDVYLKTDQLWSQYAAFYQAVSAYARSKHPGLRVGVQGTLGGMVGSWKSQFLNLTQSSDVYMASYYPLNGDVTVKDPSVVASDLNLLVTDYTALPIEIREAGYPTSAQNNSSDGQQAQFVNNVFAAWDANAGRIEYVCFTRLNDLTDAAVAADASYYQITDPRVLAYFQTLGLRTVDGTEKPALATLRQAAHARGW